MAVSWRERTSRPSGDWEVFYTTIGGSAWEADPIDILSPVEQRQARRRLSQAMVSISESRDTTDDARYWSAVVAKLVQRGTNPPIPNRAGDSILPDDPVSLGIEQVRRSLLFDPLLLDPAFELHAEFEEPFFRRLQAQLPHAAGWCTPQAPLDSLAASDSLLERWVDFLFVVPWSEQAVVVEIDGSGHASQLKVDEERDQALKRAGIRSERLVGGDHAAVDRFLSRLATRFDSYLGDICERNADVDRIVHGPGQIQRFMFAVATAVQRGLLAPGESWRLVVSDPTSASYRSVPVVLDLLAAVNDLWGLNVVPDTVTVNSRRWIRQRGSFGDGGVDLDEADVVLLLDPFAAPHHRLDPPSRPTVLIRGALLPIDLGWRGPVYGARRDGDLGGLARDALRVLLREVVGYDDFREGQSDAITRVLSGGDACVLLPTGAGKSLLYQLAGLLRPGVCLVIAPLQSLIDDQERRLREMGVDRVAGFHAGRSRDADERTALLESVASGDSLFVIVAPERLQIGSFRQALGEAASEVLVNLAVVDEAHCVSEWGHQFRTSYLRLGRNLRRLCAAVDDVPPPILALTGTASPAVLRDVLIELGLDPEEPGILHRPESFDRPNLHFEFFKAEAGDRFTAFRAVMERTATHLGTTVDHLADRAGSGTLSGIVFVPHASSGSDLGIEAFWQEVQEVTGLGRAAVARYAGTQWTKPKSGRYNGFGRADLEDWDAKNWDDFKRRNADAFRVNEAPAMVSTSAFGMGIDKPNIRWTVHVVHPNSLEAFAQEAGRAGRDGSVAYCTAIFVDDAHSVRDRKSDLEVQRYFHTLSFPERDVELEHAAIVLAELLADAYPGRRIVIPRNSRVALSDGMRQKDSDRERALYRLMLIGLVDDYTIEFKAGTFTVDLADFSDESFDRAVRSFVQRVTAGQQTYEHNLPGLATPLESRLLSYLEVVLEVLHATVVPGRRLALDEMNRVAAASPSNDELHGLLDAYLGAGMVSLLLDKISRMETLDVGAALEGIASIQPTTRQEWAASSTRYLESYPDHPIMLMVRGLGEAWLESGDRSRFQDFIEHMFRSLDDYGAGSEEAVALTRWVLESLRRYFAGDRWAWAPDLWDAWHETEWPESALLPLEDEVLDAALGGSFNVDELDTVLSRRLQRVMIA